MRPSRGRWALDSINLSDDFSKLWLEEASRLPVKVDVYHTRVFAAAPNGGNPCPVIPDAADLSDSEMLRFAKQFGLDTAFILPPKALQAHIRIRYFVPDHEMGVSGHATIAALTVALGLGLISKERVSVETTSGIFESQWQRGNGSKIVITVKQLAPSFGVEADTVEVSKVLQAFPDEIDTTRSPIQSVSVSRAKLLIPVQDSRRLDRLSPDFEAMWKLCERLNVTGFYAFTRMPTRDRGDVDARQFPYRAGFPEDAATGVAAAALAAYLTRYDLDCKEGEHAFQVGQGYAMGAPSRIEAVATCSGHEITGTAIGGSCQVVNKETVVVR